jgi:hypothetical protein
MAVVVKIRCSGSVENRQHEPKATRKSAGPAGAVFVR